MLFASSLLYILSFGLSSLSLVSPVSIYSTSSFSNKRFLLSSKCNTWLYYYILNFTKFSCSVSTFIYCIMTWFSILSLPVHFLTIITKTFYFNKDIFNLIFNVIFHSILFLILLSTLGPVQKYCLLFFSSKYICYY